MLAGDDELNIWLVIVVGSRAAWTGGSAGYRLGTRRVRGDCLYPHRGPRPYGVASAIIGQLSARSGAIALAAAGIAILLFAAGAARYHRRVSNPNVRARRRPPAS